MAWSRLADQTGIDRVLKLWKQTILAPVISSLLFIIVFGLSLGNSIAEIGGFEYQVFIVPGLIAMAMAQSAYSNNSSTIFQARNDRYLDDILSGADQRLAGPSRLSGRRGDVLADHRGSADRARAALDRSPAHAAGADPRGVPTIAASARSGSSSDSSS